MKNEEFTLYYKKLKKVNHKNIKVNNSIKQYKITKFKITFDISFSL